jgi:hypothetical protein
MGLGKRLISRRNQYKMRQFYMKHIELTVKYYFLYLYHHFLLRPASFWLRFLFLEACSS